MSDHIQVKGVVKSFTKRKVMVKDVEKDAYTMEVEYPDEFGSYHQHKFSGFGNKDFEIGQVVQFSYVQNGQYKNVKGEVVVIVGSGSEVVEEKVVSTGVVQPSKFVDRQDHIMLGQAVNLVWESIKNRPDMPDSEKIDIIEGVYTLMKKASARILGK